MTRPIEPGGREVMPGAFQDPYVKIPELEAWYSRQAEKQRQRAHESATATAEAMGFDRNVKQVFDRAVETLYRGARPCLICGVGCRDEHCPKHRPKGK